MQKSQSNNELLDEDVRQVLSGDINRYANIVKAFEPLVRTVLCAMLPSHVCLEDLTQETFIIAYRRLSSYKTGTKLSAWICTIARNVGLNERKKYAREKEDPTDFGSEAEIWQEDMIVKAMNPAPAHILDALEDGIRQLGFQAQLIVNSFYFHGLTVRQVAADLKMSEGAVKVALFRARQDLASHFRTKGIFKD